MKNSTITPSRVTPSHRLLAKSAWSIAEALLDSGQARKITFFDEETQSTAHVYICAHTDEELLEIIESAQGYTHVNLAFNIAGLTPPTSHSDHTEQQKAESKAIRREKAARALKKLNREDLQATVAKATHLTLLKWGHKSEFL